MHQHNTIVLLKFVVQTLTMLWHNNLSSIRGEMHNKLASTCEIYNPLFQQMGSRTYISCLSISPCTRLVTSGQNDNTILLWDTATHCRKHTLFGHTGLFLSFLFQQLFQNPKSSVSLKFNKEPVLVSTCTSATTWDVIDGSWAIFLTK